MSDLSDAARENMQPHEVAALEQLQREAKAKADAQHRRDGWVTIDTQSIIDEATGKARQPAKPQQQVAESDEPFECAVCDWRMPLDQCSPQIPLCARHLADVWHEMATTMMRSKIPEDQLHARPDDVHPSLRNWLPWHGSIYGFGPTGTGKTHDASALSKRAWVEWRKHFGAAPSFAWVSVPDFIEEVLDSFGTNQKVSTKWRDVDLLVLDDIGMGDDRPFAVRKLYTALERRSQRRRRQVTIITSNLNLDELAVHLKDDRIPSRIEGMCAQVSYVGLPDRRSSMGPTLQ